jgi:hypothetical protein
MKQVLRSARMRWRLRTGRRIRTCWIAGLAVAISAVAVAGAQNDEHWRKYKAEPPTAHIVVTVQKGYNGKPLPNAAVVFHAVRDGKNDGNLEVKTDPDGKATIDVIEIGSQVTVQVIATGFATTATDIDVNGPTKTLLVKLQRPRAQISEFQDTNGEPAQVKPGVQVHVLNNKRPSDPTKPTAVSPAQSNPTQMPGPLNAPPGTVTVPTQPGAPVPVGPPVAPPPTGAPLPPSSPQ